MNIRVIDICRATADEWDRIWQDCDYATYFHSREWAEVWQAYTRGLEGPEPLLLLFSDGKKALIPWSAREGVVHKSYISSPAGNFGGWISTDALLPEHAELLVAKFLDVRNNLYWRVNPFDPLVNSVSVPGTEDDVTQVIDLNGSLEEIYARWSRNHRCGYQKALRAGVTVRIAATQDDWRKYYAVYQDSLRRWGQHKSSEYSWLLFEEFFRMDSPHVKLWLAEYEGMVISGAVCFCAKAHVVFWHGATLGKFFTRYPVQLLVREMVRAAHGQGYRWFDLNPSGGHEGVSNFKKGFGVKRLAAPVICRRSVLAQVKEELKHRIYRRAKMVYDMKD